ncbi:MAG: trypsin-like peptidase domain-containing protein [Proteobacteria bacterium]|nr:trypsin-like peptidase domain-containing protein [Pseudomonadota bacterium]MBU1715526.1 trypsin-like peptidase domain-containing protein [Pseudomonadota bacterium]
MKCPKCDSEQSNTVECERCGIIFSRYARYQEKLSPGKTEEVELEKGAGLGAAQTQNSHPKKNRVLLWVIVLLVAVCLALVGKLYYQPSVSSPIKNESLSLDTKVVDREKILSDSSNQDFTPVNRDIIQKESDLGYGLSRKLSESFPANNEIASALNATVTIKTPWGSGSGFFIDDQCRIVTNRHVVEFPPDQLAEIKKQLAVGRDAISQEHKNIKYLESKVGKIRDRNDLNQVERQIEFRKNRIRSEEEKYDQMVDKIKEIESSSTLYDIKITLIDGTEYNVKALEKSRNYDLALIVIDDVSSPFISAASKNLFEQGDKVYTIGNPVGLSHTVTSGIISGRRMYDGKLYIQTDAPINPGNSGGPLINANGQALGVNTMIVRDTEGIGFAIPINKVFEEFSLSY